MTTRLIATVLFVISLILPVNVASANHTTAAHWRVAEGMTRFVMVSEHTRDGNAWRPAVGYAVNAWNVALAAAGADLVLVYVYPGNNSCRPRAGKIVVCSKTEAAPWHGSAGCLVNASDHCRRGNATFNDYWYRDVHAFPPDAPQRKMLACHEIGHTLSLAHGADPTTTCVNAQSVRTDPGSHDVEALAVMYGHRH